MQFVTMFRVYLENEFLEIGWFKGMWILDIHMVEIALICFLYTYK